MREHPMLFSAPMVRALLRQENPKTVTRRLITPHSAYFSSAPKLFWKHAGLEHAWVDGKGSAEEYLHVPCHRGDWAELDRLDKHWAGKGQEHGYRESFQDCGTCEICDHWGWRMTSHRLWPRVKPGDKIWCKEVWRPSISHHCAMDGCDCADVNIAYAADGVSRFYSDDKIPEEWLIPKTAAKGDVSPLFLPRWASRLTLDVLSVRAERLQDITEEDAEREGVVPFGEAYSGISPDQRLTTGERAGDSPFRASFAVLWDELNGDRCAWKSDPLVWRYELRRVENV